jgi:hypothetical protein
MQVIFTAKFTGIFKWYFQFKQQRSIQSIMKRAMANLAILCSEN